MSDSFVDAAAKRLLDEMRGAGVISDYAESLRAHAIANPFFDEESPITKALRHQEETQRVYGYTGISAMRKALDEAQHSLTAAAELTRSIELSQRSLSVPQLQIPAIDIPGFPGLSIPRPYEVDWNFGAQRQFTAAMRITACGWTIPHWMQIWELGSFFDDSEEEIDSYFKTKYLGNEDSQGVLDSVASELLASDDLQTWRELLEEVFDCLRMGKPKVCVPALLTVLDGFLAEHLVRKQIMPANKTNVAKYLKTFDSTEETRLVTTWWMSAVNFVESLFETTDFRTDAPTFINRHWILHGRAKTNWSMIDALKLLNALATLHSIVTEDLWPEVIDPGTAEPN